MNYDFNNKNILDFIEYILNNEYNPTSTQILNFDNDFSILFNSNSNFYIQYKEFLFVENNSKKDKDPESRLKLLTSFIEHFDIFYKFLTVIKNFKEESNSYTILINKLEKNFKHIKELTRFHNFPINHAFFDLFYQYYTLSMRHSFKSVWIEGIGWTGLHRSPFLITAALPNLLTIEVAQMKVLRIQMDKECTARQIKQKEFVSFVLDKYPKVKESIETKLRTEIIKII